MTDYRATIVKQSHQITTLLSRIKESSNREPKGIEYHAARQEFHEYYLAVQIYIDNIINRITSNDSEALDYTLQFLEVDPKFYRSGYIKEKMLHKLKYVSFNKKQKIQLQQIILSYLKKPYFTREHRYYINLAVLLNDETFFKEINILLNSSNSIIISKAKNVSDRIIKR